jgi:hypothetical protein
MIFFDKQIEEKSVKRFLIKIRHYYTEVCMRPMIAVYDCINIDQMRKTVERCVLFLDEVMFVLMR